MKRSTRLRTTAVSAAMVPLLLLLGCGSDDDSDDETSSTPSSETTPSEDPTSQAPTEEPSASETTTEDETATGTAGSAPEWANPVTKPGDLLTTVALGDIEVEVYQVGTAKAPKDGMFLDPETNKPILKKGDELVWVNYVATNNGAPIDLGSSLISSSPRYEDWKWMQGMDGSVDRDLMAQMQVNAPGVAPGAFADPSVYAFGTGQSISWGESFKYQKGSKIDFEFSVVPVDAKGDLVHDQKVEATASTTIK